MQRENLKPLRLEPAPVTYSDAMPDIHQVLEWTPLAEASAAATDANRPIFAVVVAAWSTGAHLVYRELEHPEIQKLIAEQFVPVLIDPVSEPALAEKIAAMARYQGGSGAFPLLTVLSPQLEPALSVAYTSPENRQSGLPSTQSVLRSVAEQWGENSASFADEWNTAKGQLHAAPEVLQKDADLGGFQENPRHLRPYALVDASRDDGANDPWLQQTLTNMWDLGIRDQLEASFHPRTRDDSFVVPYFEKLIPQNAAMALVYARVAKHTGNRELRSHAQDLVRIVLGAVLKATDVVSAESNYYTWKSNELYDAVSRKSLQPISLIYNVQPNERRQVLSKARTVEQLAEMSYEPLQEHEKRFLTGNAELLMHRRTRPAPRPLSLNQPAWRAETWRWLFLAMDSLESSDKTLLTSGYLGWLAEIAPNTESGSDITATGFQNDVSVLASLLVARDQIEDTAIQEMIPTLYARVKTGAEHWRQADQVDALWIHRHGYLPSVASSLAAIAESLPDDDGLLALS